MSSTNIITLTVVIAVIAVILIIVVAAVIALAIVLTKKKKNKKISVDDEFIDTLVFNYGGLDNLVSVDIENARVKITVEDIDKVNLDELKKQTESGVFVTGYTVKTLYKLDSEKIKKSLELRIKEKKND